MCPTTEHPEWWVRAQIPLLAATIAWPVVQHLLRTGNGWISPLEWPSRAVGSVLILVSILVFRGASQILGEDLIAVPTPRREGQLQQEGIYARVRHPVYSALMLGMVGWALLWTSYLGIALSLVCVLFFVLKTRVEERLLRARYPEYADYERLVPRYIPKIRRPVLK